VAPGREVGTSRGDFCEQKKDDVSHDDEEEGSSAPGVTLIGGPTA